MPSDTEPFTYDLSLLEASQREWDRSAGLRAVYSEIYQEIRAQCVQGPSLEIGSGIAASRHFFTQLTTSDIVKTRFVDRAVSAYAIKQTAEDEECWSNIFAVDVLHHLTRPMDFFSSAAAALPVGGRLILTEPAATCFGRFFYTCFHHEPIEVKQVNPPFEFQDHPSQEGLGFANMGMGFGMFEVHAEQLRVELQAMGLYCKYVKYRDLLAYPLSGGYSKPQQFPTACLRALLAIEAYLPQFLLKKSALRMVIVLEKR